MTKIHLSITVVILQAASILCSAQVTFTAYQIPTSFSQPQGITTGPDGNLWFTERLGVKIGKLTPAGGFTEYPIPTPGSYPNSITTGPDGNLWFTERLGRKIGKISTAGVITEFPLALGTCSASSCPSGGLYWITAGPDGNLWFTEELGDKIGKITTAGVITEFSLATSSDPVGITAGPDGNVWFTEQTLRNTQKIGRITPTGVITEFPLPHAGGLLYGIAAGPDGNLWFPENDGDKIGRITTAGVITEFPVPTTGGGPYQITAGPDGNVWFTESNANKIGRVTPDGVVTEFFVSTGDAALDSITTGPDGNLWITDGNTVVKATLPKTPPGTLTIYPSTGGNAGNVTVQIFGNGFQSGATVKLTGVGSDIGGTNTTVTNGSVITATFDLTGAATGLRTVVITNPDNTTVTLPNGFTVEQGGAPQISVNIIGRQQIRIGQAQQYYIAFTNQGNLDSSPALAALVLPQGVLASTTTDNTTTFTGGSTSNGNNTVLLTAVNSIPAGGMAILPAAITLPGGTIPVGTIRGGVINSFSLSAYWNSSDGAPDTSTFTFDQYAGFKNYPFIPYNASCPSSLNAYNNELQFHTVALQTYIDLGNLQLTKYQAQLALARDAGLLIYDIATSGEDIRRILGSQSFPQETVFEMAADAAKDQGEDALKDFFADTAPNSYFDAWNAELNSLASTIPGLKTVIMASYPALSTILPQLDAITNAYNQFGPLVSAYFVARTPDQSANNAFMTAFGNYSAAEQAYKTYIVMNCGGNPTNPPPPTTGPGSTIAITGVQSLDPNVKVGPAGAGPSMYIPSAVRLGYSVYFDNEPTATAPAQAVTVTDTLDASLDASTLTLGPITFPNQVVIPPSIPMSVSPFTTTVDLRPTTNLLVKVTANLNSSTATFVERFQSLDPSTNLPPTDPLAGFLPPGAEGSVFFTARAKSTVTTGTVIQNTATIVFDVNAPINTPTWSNTVDNTKPVSNVSALPSTQTLSSFPVQWSGTDVGSGVQDFTVYVSDNGGAFVPAVVNATATQGIFNGLGGHTYGFYSIARDLVGNVESSKTLAEATTRVIADTTPPLIVPQISGTLGNSGWYRSSVTVSWSVTDPESGIASSSGCNTSTPTADTASVTLTCLATNGAGLSSSVPVTIKIDKTPPVISGMPTPSCTLWPTTGKLAQVATVTAADALSGLAPGSFSVTGTSNEPSDPNKPQIVITPNGSGGFIVQLQADRLGTGTGRIYTLTATAGDLAGNVAMSTATCTVPHDQGN